ncbi:hypothetical protein [Butyricimonas virosa]|uniref:hypothetical protein n=1 Tax=Butyricimonas virosa TaxID=544645 RepID=UPI00242B6654|nr:hypothetical protein [Butyricimonas virosa]
MTFRDLRYFNLEFVNAGGYIKYLLRLPSLRRLRHLLKKNEELIRERKHDTCYVCGLGPSLADIDLDKLQDLPVDTLVVNYFVRMAGKTRLYPTYYMMADAGFVSSKHRAGLEMAIEKFPESRFIWNSSFPTIDKTVMDYPCRKYFMAMYKGYYIRPKKIDITKIMPAFGNCICVAIAFAIGVGYKKIVLLGCDFNSFAQQHEAHCYDGGSDSKLPRRVALDQELFSYSFDATVHLRLAAYADRMGIEILNATRGSLIDAYKRVDVSELYK